MAVTDWFNDQNWKIIKKKKGETQGVKEFAKNNVKDCQQGIRISVVAK